MKARTYPTALTQKAGKSKKVQIDVTKLPSQLHKYGALKNKSARFEDRRFKKPKHKVCIFDLD